MYRRVTIGTVLFVLCALQFSFAQDKARTEIDERIWSQQYWLELGQQGLVPLNPVVEVPEAIEAMQTALSPMAIGDNNPDVAVTSASNTTQSENSIFVNPNDNNKVLSSNNSTDNPVSSVFGTSGFMSSNGAASFSGSIQGTGGGNSGDPAAVINLAGRYFVGYIAANGGQGVAYSDNEGASWTDVQIAPNPGSLADKNHFWVDNSPSSPYQGRLYSAWTDFGGAFDGDVVISRSTNNGTSWTTRQNLSNSLPGFQQGVHIQTGPNGEVYAFYTNYVTGGVQDEPAYALSRSFDGGVTWSTSTIISNTRGIRLSTTSKNMRVNSFPVSAVDISGGPNNGNLYMVWANIGVPGVNTGNDIDIYMIRSTDQGASWSSPIRVNQDPTGQGNEHFFPWITCDPVTGDLSVIYYDDRNVGSSQCQVYVAVSQDAGNSWTDFQVSDVTFTPSPIPGLAGGYFGDYLAIAARGGKVYPAWTDNRTGAALTYVSPFDITGTGNQAPVAEANGPYSGAAGSPISFSSAGSNDPDGTIVSYLWNFGDGNTSSAANPSHTYATGGTYNVTLTVTDDGGFQNSDGATASVSFPPGNFASLPYSTGFESGAVDQFWQLFAGGSEGRILVTSANTPHTGSFHLTMDDNLNGGAFSQNEAWLRLDLSGESQVELDFWWKDFSDENHVQDGVFLSDDDGASFTKVLDLNGQSFTNNVWNNFNLDIDQLASSNGLSLSSTFVIKFQQYDNFSITTDGHAWDDISVTGGAANAPPTANANGPYTGQAGTAVSFSSSGSSDSDGTITGYLWDFGDGNSSTAANPSHTYASAGTYNVSLTVTDNGGLQDTDNTTATISNPPTGTWDVIAFDDFEAGWGNYVDGGSDCRRSANDAPWASQGTYCVRIRDNTNTSVFTSNPGFNVSGYDEGRIQFSFYSRSMEVNEDFWVQISNNGSSWTTIASFARGVDFENNIFYDVTNITFDLAANGIGNTLYVRFRNDASVNNDRIYIDEVEVAARTNTSMAEQQVQQDLLGAPAEFVLEQNYPNPFNPSTTISFALAKDSDVSLKVYDISGRLVQELVGERRSAGRYSVQWHGDDTAGRKVASGIYVYRIVAGDFVQTKRLIYLK